MDRTPRRPGELQALPGDSSPTISNLIHNQPSTPRRSDQPSRHHNLLTSPVRSPSRSPKSKIIYGDRFVPTRATLARLNYSVFEGDVAAADVAKATAEREDLSPTYSLLLRSVLFGDGGVPIARDREAQLKQLRSPVGPGKSLFKFRHGDEHSPLGGPPTPSPLRSSPFAIGDDFKIHRPPSGPVRSPSRSFPKHAFKVLDAPGLQDNFYLSVIDWSSQNVLAVGLENSVHLFSARSGKVTHLVDVPSDIGGLSSLGWSPGGTYLAVGCGSGLLQVWDVSRKQLLRTFQGHSGRVGTVSWGGVVLSTGSQDRSIAHRDLRSPEEFIGRYTGHRAEICGLKWSLDDRYLASGCNGNGLMTWGLRSTNPEHVFTGHTAAVRALDWSPRQPALLASGGGTVDRHIRIWNVESGAAVKAVDTGSQVCQVRWSLTTPELVSTHGFSRNEICVWSYPGLSKLASVRGHQSRVLYMAMSPDGRSVVTGAGDETVRLWDLFPPAPEEAAQRSGSVRGDATSGGPTTSMATIR